MRHRQPALYILTTEDPLYSAQLIERLAQEFPGQIQGVGLTGGLLSKQRILLSPLIYGCFSYLKLGLKVIWSMAFGGKIAAVCKQHGIPVDELPSVGDGKLLEILTTRGIELMVSVNCSQRLREREFAAPKFGTINIHNSALPEYRGLMPILHAIRDGRQRNGVTIHCINATLDDGAILSQEFVPIVAGDHLLSVWRKCVELGCETLPRVIQAVLAGTAVTQPNDAGRASYFSFPTLAQIREYRRARRLLRRKDAE